MPRLPPALPQHALAVYAEPLAARRRVVVFGEDETLADRLLDLGAREVRLLRGGDDLDRLPTASFDLALVTDLGAFDEPGPLLAALRRLLGDGGAALVVAANRDAVREPEQVARAFDYYELFDLVAGEFADVKMIAQVPFHGVVLAELGVDEESPAVSVDTQLAAEPQVPQAYVALASQRGVELEAYAIFELPPPAPMEPVEQEAPQPDLDALIAVQDELAREKLRAEALSTQLDTLRPQVARAMDLEREVVARGRALAELSTEVEEVRAAAEAGAAAAAQIEELGLRADRAERALARAQPELERMAEAHAAELHQFELALRERAAAVRTLEAEVARRERIVHELLATLEEQAAAVPAQPSHDGPSDGALDENHRLRERLDAMAIELARREGEAQASGWKLAELERRLGEAPARPGPPSSTPDRSRELAAALDEIDALRRALTQEHEQRVLAESALGRAAGVGGVGVEPSA
jgi:DNA repair exonuclease SbcCD ATPase subunit